MDADRVRGPQLKSSRMNWYVVALRKYAVFQGRARRSEYWYFVLFNIIIGFVLGFMDVLMGTYDFEVGMGLLGGLYSLVVLLPGIGVSVRRLHDIGRTGWWLLILFVPIVGAIVLIVFAIQDSESAVNKFGPNPKAEATA